MEELQVIETTSGRQFKPWASREDVQIIKQETVQAVVQAVQDPASITAIASEIAGGKAAIASAINAKGGTASATESFAELAQAVEEIPNFSDMVKLAGIIAGGDYNKNALQGHNENVKYGKTEIVDNVGAFEIINLSFCFQYWDLLKSVTMNALTTISGGNTFAQCTALQSATMNALTTISGHNLFYQCTALQSVTMNALTTISGNFVFEKCTALQSVELGTLITINAQPPLYDAKPNLRNITIGQDTDINLPFQQWTSTNVIAEGQTGIDELNSNLYNNLLTKLYDHSSDGQTRTLRIGWLAKVTQENIAYANAKGWTLTT